jgi:hypothetical protein
VKVENIKPIRRGRLKAVASGTVAVRDGAGETDRRIWKTWFTFDVDRVYARGLFGTATTRGGRKKREKINVRPSSVLT